MKLTIKLLIGLGSIFVFLLIISAFSIKKEYAKIDKSDMFWNFEKHEVGKFKHVKIVGNTKITGKLRIMQGQKFQVMVSDKFASSLKPKLNGDTLVVNFDIRKQEIPAYQMSNLEILVISPELKSLQAIDQVVEVLGFNQESIKIDCGYNSNISLEKNTFKNIKLALDINSNFNFNSQSGFVGDYDFQPENLEVVMKRNSSLNMSNVLPKRMTLRNDERSYLNLNSATLNLLRK